MMLQVFFFQAEDGIRDVAVTGVQTCALPISPWHSGDLALVQDLPQRMRECVGLQSTISSVKEGSRSRSEEHTSELQSRLHLVCRLLLEKKKEKKKVESIWTNIHMIMQNSVRE